MENTNLWPDKSLVWDIGMYADHAFQNAHVNMSDITRCKNKSSIIHISRSALKFTNLADYLQIYSANFEVTTPYCKWQDLSKSYPEDGLNYMCSHRRLVADWQHFENTTLSDFNFTSHTIQNVCRCVVMAFRSLSWGLCK